MAEKLKAGMVGGGRGAFIGEVHRKAMALDAQIELVAGALSSTPEKSRASGRDLGLAEERNYGSWQEMLERESARPQGERIDFVSIVTPNHLHYPVAQAFVEAGFNVVCDKPLVNSSAEARALLKSVERTGVVFAVTYNYTGYPLVRQARAMIEAGDIGKLRKVIVEYNQGWLATRLESEGAKQAEWRTDPQRAGLAGALGDIGSHAENLVAVVTGLEVESLCADLTTFVAGRQLDDDANMLLRFRGGAKGVLIASQIEVGQENDLRLRVFGETGSLSWRQENPNYLVYDRFDQPRQVLTRGSDYLSEAAKQATRLPPGHPEAFIEAFANIYLGAAEAMRARRDGKTAAERPGGFPTVYDGARGVHFIERAVASSKSKEKWTDASWQF